jgi:NTE family protein
MSEPVMGLALGSGGSRGFAHIGVIEVLEEEGLRPDVIAGCSIGAMVGAAYLTGRLKDLRDWAEALTWHEVAGLLDISLTGGGLFVGELIERHLDVLGIIGNIEDLDRPFATVATNYLTGLEQCHREGPIGKVVRASMSIPGVLTPAKLGDDWFVDGGLVNPIPVSICWALGAKFVIAINLNDGLVGSRELPGEVSKMSGGRGEMVEHAVAVLPASWREGTERAVHEFLKPRPPKPGYFEVLANSINIMQDHITRSSLAREPPHVMIVPQLGSMGPFDFDQAKMAIEEGRKCTRNALPEIRRNFSANASIPV